MKGWHGEPMRHSLARKGVKTGQKVNPSKISISKKRQEEIEKNNIVDSLLNDLSGEEQELILRSKRYEMDEEYLERLDNKLWNMSLPKLRELHKKFGLELE